MNKWLLLAIPFLVAFTPIYDKHTELPQVDDELNAIEDQVQDKQFRVVSGTPTLGDLEDHEVVIVSSNGAVRLMFRDNIEIYSVNASCVTVIR